MLFSAPVDDQDLIAKARHDAVQAALNIAADNTKSPGKKHPTPPKPRKRPESVRPVQAKDLKSAPKWAWDLYRKAKADAHRRGISWQLSPQEFAWLVRVSDGVCSVTGLRFDIPTGKRRGPFGPSLDRIESSQPYVLANVRIVCVAANIAMNAWGLETFLKVARAAVRHNASTPYSNDDRCLEYEGFQKQKEPAVTNALAL